VLEKKRLGGLDPVHELFAVIPISALIGVGELLALKIATILASHCASPSPLGTSKSFLVLASVFPDIAPNCDFSKNCEDPRANCAERGVWPTVPHPNCSLQRWFCRLFQTCAFSVVPGAVFLSILSMPCAGLFPSCASRAVLCAELSFDLRSFLSWQNVSVRGLFLSFKIRFRERYFVLTYLPPPFSEGWWDFFCCNNVIIFSRRLFGFQKKQLLEKENVHSEIREIRSLPVLKKVIGAR